MGKNNHTSSEIALDAFNTANKCGLLPSELLGQRGELLDAFKSSLTHYTNMYEFETGCESNSVTESAWDTINQIEQ